MVGRAPRAASCSTVNPDSTLSGSSSMTSRAVLEKASSFLMSSHWFLPSGPRRARLPVRTSAKRPRSLKPERMKSSLPFSRALDSRFEKIHPTKYPRRSSHPRRSSLRGSLPRSRRTRGDDPRCGRRAASLECRTSALWGPRNSSRCRPLANVDPSGVSMRRADGPRTRPRFRIARWQCVQPRRARWFAPDRALSIDSEPIRPRGRAVAAFAARRFC